MAEISATTIGRMRDVPSDSSRIELYNYNGSEDMTIGQLVVALSIRCCAIYERDSVVQMNLMNRGVENINLLSGYVNYVLTQTDDSFSWSGYRLKLASVLGTNTPTSITNESDRKKVLDEIQMQIDYLESSISSLDKRDRELLQECKGYIETMSDGGLKWGGYRSVLIDRFGIADSALPSWVSSYTDKMTAIEQLQQALTKENSSVDRIAIEAETAINRRDSMYSMATKCVTHFGGSLMTAATNMVMR